MWGVFFLILGVRPSLWQPGTLNSSARARTPKIFKLFCASKNSLKIKIKVRTPCFDAERGSARNERRYDHKERIDDRKGKGPALVGDTPRIRDDPK